MVKKQSKKSQKGGETTVPEVPTTPEVPKPVVEPVKEVVEPVKEVVEPAADQVPQQGGAKKQKGGVVDKKRTFKIKLEDEKFCSRITGNTPKQAASKALTLLVNQKKQQGKSVKGKVVFTIKETTRGSKGKEYSYQGEKIKLKQPTTYKIKSSNGEVKEIINKYKNVIEKYQVQ